MITELVILLAIFAFVLAGAFFGTNGPRAVFERSGPRLGARIEQNLGTGGGFAISTGSHLLWQIPPGAAPDGSLK